MSWFGAFRSEYGFTWYGDNRTPVRFDFPLVTVTYLCVLIGVATLISTLGIRGRERWATTLRASYAVGLASIILVCLVGHGWLVGQTEVKTHYLYRSDNYFRGTVGLRVALQGCNITLEGYYTGVNGEGHVYYAESMKWRDFGREKETISPYLHRGLPHPVLTVLDFLSADGGGLRWGRSFHSAGYFAYALLWTSFAFWIISNVLLMSVVSYGAFMFFLTGTAMVLCCVVYHVCQPPNPLRVHFGDSVLTTSYGWCFWLLLASGIVTLILGAALFVCDHVFHEKVSEFFNLENLDEDDLPDYGHGYDFSMKHQDKTSSLLTFNSGSGRPGSGHKLSVPDFQRPSNDYRRHSTDSRRPSLLLGQPQGPQQQQPRRPSIFLEPERRPSDQSMRRGSFVHLAAGGITNKGFEQERPIIKTNPLFNPDAAASTTGEDGGGDGRMREVKVEVEGVVVEGYPNRKPSLSTMKEHHQNHINQRQQQQQQEGGDYITSSAGGGGDEVITCTAVVIEAPSDDNTDDNDVDGREVSRRKSSREPGSTKKEEREVHKGHESGSDSAIASGAPSPTGSAKNSTCGECEDMGH